MLSQRICRRGYERFWEHKLSLSNEDERHQRRLWSPNVGSVWSRCSSQRRCPWPRGSCSTTARGCVAWAWAFPSKAAFLCCFRLIRQVYFGFLTFLVHAPCHITNTVLFSKKDQISEQCSTTNYIFSGRRTNIQKMCRMPLLSCQPVTTLSGLLAVNKYSTQERVCQHVCSITNQVK